MVQKRIPSITSKHDSETRNIINEIIKAINDRGLEILSESSFLIWLEKNGIKHRAEVATFSDLPASDSLNTVRGVADENKIYIKKENGWVAFQTIDISKINDLDNKLNEVQVYARDFGVVADGITDDSVALQNTINAAAGRPIILPNAKINVASRITYSGELNLRGSGSTTEIDLSNGGELRFERTLLNIPDLSANIRKGTSTVDFVSAHNLSEGDVFIVYNPTDYSWAKYRNYYRDGCMFKVDRVTSANQVKIFGVSPDTYNASAMRNFKLRGQGINLENFKIIPNPESTLQVVIDGHQKVNINNVTIPRGSMYTGIEVHRCYELNVDLLNAEVVNGDAYPISISNTQKVTISQSALYSARHAIALGGRTGNGCVPTRDVLIDQCILMNRSENGIGVADMHGNCTDVTYSNCILNTGAIMAGKNVKYENCTIYGRDPDFFADGNCIFGGEVVGGFFEIEDCRFITTGNGRAFGIVHFSITDLEYNFNLNIKDCSVENTGDNTSIRFLVMAFGDLSGHNHKINISVTGLRSSNELAQIFNIAGQANIEGRASLIIDDLRIPGTTSFFGSTNPVNFNIPMRLQRQSGIVTVNTVSGRRDTNAETQYFKYRYPRPPVATVVANMVDESPQNSTESIIGGVRTTKKSYIIPNLHTSNTDIFWSSEVSANIMWTVGIDEI